MTTRDAWSDEYRFICVDCRCRYGKQYRECDSCGGYKTIVAIADFEEYEKSIEESDPAKENRTPITIDEILDFHIQCPTKEENVTK